MSAEQITTLEQLMTAGARCVTIPKLWAQKPIPIAFIVSMQARLVHSYIRAGMFLYTPKSKIRA